MLHQCKNINCNNITDYSEYCYDCSKKMEETKPICLALNCTNKAVYGFNYCEGCLKLKSDEFDKKKMEEKKEQRCKECCKQIPNITTNDGLCSYCWQNKFPFELYRKKEHWDKCVNCPNTDKDCVHNYGLCPSCFAFKHASEERCHKCKMCDSGTTGTYCYSCDHDIKEAKWLKTHNYNGTLREVKDEDEDDDDIGYEHGKLCQCDMCIKKSKEKLVRKQYFDCKFKQLKKPRTALFTEKRERLERCFCYWDQNAGKWYPKISDAWCGQCKKCNEYCPVSQMKENGITGKGGFCPSCYKTPTRMQELASYLQNPPLKLTPAPTINMPNTIF